MPKAAYIAFFLGAVVFLSAPAVALSGPPETTRKEDHLETLGRIYEEVKELGPQAGQDFIRWDFFVGEGDDDTNKPVHAVVLIQGGRQKEKMTLLISRMEPSPGDPGVFWNKEAKEISCLVKNSRAELVSSAFTTRELERLLPGLLLAVQDKKRLLRGI
jgi:hypothetical protein